MIDRSPRSAYFHVPFCRRRCGYCSFAIVAGRDDLIDAYLRAIEIELTSLGRPHEVDTLYLGGGTPTHLSPEQLERFFHLASQWLPGAEGAEVSVEANPEDYRKKTADVLHRCGVRRVSFGVQSFDDRKLDRLERQHRAADIDAAVALARQYEQSISLDLIFGTPEETLADWQADLGAALARRPDHLSCYALTYERGAAFWSRLQHGELHQVDEQTDRAMYEHAIDAAAASGLEQYEVSNFARAGHRCRHNEVYWSLDGWLAFGPSAVRSIGLRRETNHRSVTTWLKKVLAGQSPVSEVETLTEEQAARERLVFGLRTVEGIDVAMFEEATGFSPMPLGGDAMKRFVDWGLLEQTSSRIKLTRSGLMVSDSIAAELI